MFNSVKSFEELVGRKTAEGLVYRFGYKYGERLVQGYVEKGILKDDILKIANAFFTVIYGWGIFEKTEANFEKGFLKIKITNDMEANASLETEGIARNNLIRGFVSGVFSKLIDSKVQSSFSHENGISIITVEKRNT